MTFRKGNPPSRNGSHEADPRTVSGGFALVVALSLMALVMVLLLSLTALVRVESSASVARMESLEARQNALLGAYLAVGRLQAELGADRRVNVQAALGLPRESKRPQARWTGVFDGRESAGLPDPEIGAAPEFRRWLVSAGGAGGTPAWSSDFGEVASESFDPEAELDDAVAMVDGTGRDRVVAGKVAVPGGAERNGKFAWWIADENSKVLLREDSRPGRDAEAWRQARSTAPAPAYPLLGADFEWLSANDPILGRLNTREALDLSPSAPSGGVDRAALFHRVTPHAFGVLADVRRGGLRKDLSFYLEQPHAERPLEALYGMPGLRDRRPTRRPDAEAGNREPVQLAGIDFDGLWAFHNLWKTLGRSGAGPLLESDYATDFRSPVAHYKKPIILRAGWFIAVSAEPNPDSVAAGDDPLQYDALIRFNPFVVLWNPYTAPIRVGGGDEYEATLLGVPYEIRFFSSKSLGDIAGAAHRYDYWLARNTGSHSFERVTMELTVDEPIELEAGEVKIYSLGGAAGDEIQYSDQKYNVPGSPGWDRMAGGIIGRGGEGAVTFEEDDFLYVNLRPMPPRFGENSEVGRGYGRAGPFYYSGFLGVGRAGGEVRYLDGAVVNSEGFPYGQRPPHRFFDHPDKFPTVPDPADGLGDKVAISLPVGSLEGSWQDVAMLVFELRTEQGQAEWPEGPFLHHVNPGAPVQQIDGWADGDLLAQPYRFRAEALTGGPNSLNDILEVDGSDGSIGFFGSTYGSGVGMERVVTRAIPEGPVYNLADFQHAATLGRGHFEASEARDDLPTTRKIGGFIGPVVDRPIGNSYAPAVLEPDQLRGINNAAALDPPTFGGFAGVPAIDHSYLANHALWDRWYFSSIGPEPDANYGVGRDAETVWNDFLEGANPLPHQRMRALAGATDAPLFDGDGATDDAHLRSAAHLLVEGAFNVNSTDPEVWAAQLAQLREVDVPVREPGGSLAWNSTDGGTTPLTTLFTPADGAESAGDLSDPASPEQWRGFRELSDDDILTFDGTGRPDGGLAYAIAEEVRARGPFLSLADFVNRDPLAANPDHAAKGALQAALDRTVNPGASGMGNSRWVGTDPSADFPEALEVPKALGMPGWILQADLLAALGPLPAARSDTFTIRAYGEADGPLDDRNDDSGVWCEMVVQRLPDYVDPTNPAHTPVDSAEATAAGLAELSESNQRFGRRFYILSFRWLEESEL